MKGDDLLAEISKKLSAILALLLTADVQERNTAQKVEMLVRFGLPNQQIADIVGTTKGTVEVLKSRGNKRSG